MITLFFGDANLETGNFRPARVERIRRVVEPEVEKIKKYYRNRETKVPNSSTLVRLLKHLNNKELLTSKAMIYTLNNSATHLARQFKITSQISRGELKDEPMFGSSKVLLVNVETQVRFIDPDDWEEFKPLRFVREPDVNLSLAHPTNKTQIGVAIIEIDIPLLALQFFKWSEKRVSLQMSTDPATFLCQYPLTNTIENSFDLAILKYFFELDTKYPFINSHPFTVNNYAHILNPTLTDIYKKVSKNKLNYRTILNNIPVFFNVSGRDVTLIRNKYPSARNRYVNWYCSFEWFFNLFMLSKENRTVNKKDFIDFENLMRVLTSGNYLNIDDLEIFTYKWKEKYELFLKEVSWKHKGYR